MNKISCTDFLDQELGENVFLAQNTVLNMKTVSKAVFDPQIFYRTVFQVLHDFQEKLTKFGI